MYTLDEMNARQGGGRSGKGKGEEKRQVRKGWMDMNKTKSKR